MSLARSCLNMSNRLTFLNTALIHILFIQTETEIYSPCRVLLKVLIRRNRNTDSLLHGSRVSMAAGRRWENFGFDGVEVTNIVRKAEATMLQSWESDSSPDRACAKLKISCLLINSI